MRTPWASQVRRTSKYGAPIGMPKALASDERAITQPSLFESTTMGTPTSEGSSTRSHEA